MFVFLLKVVFVLEQFKNTGFSLIRPVYVDSCHLNVPATYVCGLVGRTHMGNAA